MERRYTTAFAASKALYAAAAAKIVDPAVTVSWGYPGENAAAELVWVGEFEASDQEPAAIGRGRREERYTISVYVDVAMTTSDPADVNERAGQLVHLVEEAVHEDPHLGQALGNDGVAQIGDVETVVPTQNATDTSFINVTRVRVACRARI